MTNLTTTSHISKRTNGMTARTTEFFDEAGILIKKETQLFNSDNAMILIYIDDKIAQTTTELKPIKGYGEVHAIKTIYNAKSYILSQGMADKDGEYHGIISVFKPHKTRYEEYEHGKKIADLTHHSRNVLLKWSAIAIALATGGAVLYKCLNAPKPTPEKDNMTYIRG